MIASTEPERQERMARTAFVIGAGASVAAANTMA
jgi:hypothetical protein